MMLSVLIQIRKYLYIIVSEIKQSQVTIAAENRPIASEKYLSVPVET